MKIAVWPKHTYRNSPNRSLLPINGPHVNTEVNGWKPGRTRLNEVKARDIDCGCYSYSSVLYALKVYGTNSIEIDGLMWHLHSPSQTSTLQQGPHFSLDLRGGEGGLVKKATSTHVGAQFPALRDIFSPSFSTIIIMDQCSSPFDK